MEINPISVLHEYCQKKKEANPKFHESCAVGEDKKVLYQISLTVQKKLYGPVCAPSKSKAKTGVAVLACNDLKLYHTAGKQVQKPNKSTAKTDLNIITQLYEYCQQQKWLNAKVELVREEGEPHDRTYALRYTLGGREFPVGAGKNKDSAKQRAAARALSELKEAPLRVFLKHDISFGVTVCEYAWEAFGILCEELGESSDFCQTSQLACFLLENLEDGTFRVVGLGSGNGVASSEWQACKGESVIDCHSVVIARRCLLVFLYEQLIKLFSSSEEENIFQFAPAPYLASLKPQYQIHLYLKEAPCGDASLVDATAVKVEKKYNELAPHDHEKVYNESKKFGLVKNKASANIVSCTDKILLWNVLGVQGNLLSNFIPKISISSITVSRHYNASSLARAFCCRYGNSIHHPWIQHGIIEGVEKSNNTGHEKSWAIYWTHGPMDLKEDFEDLVKNAGILNSQTGTHVKGSNRYQEIPIICKRNIYLKYKKLCSMTKQKYSDKYSYSYTKNLCPQYKIDKNTFFMRLETLELGRFPIIDSNVDKFWLDDGDTNKNCKKY